jgi:hypothetical protein
VYEKNRKWNFSWKGLDKVYVLDDTVSMLVSFSSPFPLYRVEPTDLAAAKKCFALLIHFRQAQMEHKGIPVKFPDNPIPSRLYCGLYLPRSEMAKNIFEGLNLDPRLIGFFTSKQRYLVESVYNKEFDSYPLANFKMETELIPKKEWDYFQTLAMDRYRSYRTNYHVKNGWIFTKFSLSYAI